MLSSQIAHEYFTEVILQSYNPLKALYLKSMKVQLYDCWKLAAQQQLVTPLTKYL